MGGKMLEGDMVGRSNDRRSNDGGSYGGSNGRRSYVRGSNGRR